MKSKQNKTERKIEKKGQVYIEQVTIEYELDEEGLQQRIDLRKNAIQNGVSLKQKKIFDDDIKYFEEAKLKGKTSTTFINDSQ